MKKFIFYALLFGALAGVCSAQGYRAGSDVGPVTSYILPGGPISTVPNAVISVCAYPANAVPCTNKATTYTDATLTTPCASNQQVVLAGTTNCVTTADGGGNWGVWLTPGSNYSYTVTLPSGASAGPYTITASSVTGGSGCIPGGSAGTLQKNSNPTGSCNAAAIVDTAGVITASEPVGITASGGVTTPAVNNIQQVDGVHYPLTGAGLQAAITAAANSEVVVCPTGGTLFVESTINVTSQVWINGCGGPGQNGSTIIDFTGTGTLFNVSANLGFHLSNLQVTGVANPAVSIPNCASNGQNYLVDNVWAQNVTSFLNIGNSCPFLIVKDSHLISTQYDISVGQDTDCDIHDNYFESGVGTTAQADIILAGGAGRCSISNHNTFVGTGTTSPDIQINVVGGTLTTGIDIDHNNFGQDLLGAAATRILYHYSGTGTATVAGCSNSYNYVENGALVADFAQVDSPTNVNLQDCHFDGNRVTAAAGGGWVLDNNGSPPASGEDTAVGNMFGSVMAASIRNNAGFVAWDNNGNFVFPNGGSFGGTVDASGATQFKLPVAAGYASAANGEIGYDSTNLNWHLFGNGVDNIAAVFPASLSITNGHCVDWSKVGTVITLADAGSACGSGGSGCTVSGTNGNLLFVNSTSCSNADALNYTSPLLTHSETGVFTNTQANLYTIFKLNSCDAATRYHFIQGGFETEPITGCNSVPSGAAAQSNPGIAGYVDTSQSSNSGAGPDAEGIYGQCISLAIGGGCWGLNAGVSDGYSPATHSGTSVASLLYAAEFDVWLGSSGSSGAGIQVNGTMGAQATRSSTTSGNMPAVDIVRPTSNGGSGIWTAGFACEAGSTDNGTGLGNCVDIAPALSSGNDVGSLGIALHSTSSTGTLLTGSVNQFTSGNNTAQFSYNGSGGYRLTATNTYSQVSSSCAANVYAWTIITDATTNTWGDVISAGGGSDVVLAFCDGTNWTVAASKTGSALPTGPAGGVLSGNYPNPAIAAGANLGTPGTLVLTNATGLPCGAMPALTGGVTSSAGSCATTVPSASIGATQLAAQYSKKPCTAVWGGTGTANALQSGDDTIAINKCFNSSNEPSGGVSYTIVAVGCSSDAASSPPTVNPTMGTAGTGTTILSAALTCGTSNAWTWSTSISNATWAAGTGVAPAMGSPNGTNMAITIEYTY